MNTLDSLHKLKEVSTAILKINYSKTKYLAIYNEPLKSLEKKKDIEIEEHIEFKM